MTHSGASLSVCLLVGRWVVRVRECVGVRVCIDVYPCVGACVYPHPHVSVKACGKTGRVFESEVHRTCFKKSVAQNYCEWNVCAHRHACVCVCVRVRGCVSQPDHERHRWIRRNQHYLRDIGMPCIPAYNNNKTRSPILLMLNICRNF